jgi:hypothetical protein
MSTRNLPGVKDGWPARKADNLTAICDRLPRKCVSLDVSQPYGPLRPVTEIAWRVGLRTSQPCVNRFPRNVGASTSHNPMDLHGLSQGQLCHYLSARIPTVRIQEFWDFPQPVQAKVTIVPRSNDDRFLPNPFQFTCHPAIPGCT